MKKVKNLKLSSPWVTFQHEVDALFGQDPEIRIVMDDDAMELKMFVSNSDKAAALGRILPEEKNFGNVTLKIVIVPPNNDGNDILSDFCEAFAGNPVLENIVPIDCPIGQFNYIVFKKEVVQFFNDQLDDLNGNRSTLYQDIAKDVLKDGMPVYYCTEADKLIKPLGEWP